MRALPVSALLAVLAFVAVPGTTSAAPSCAEGPQTVGETIVGTPCADTIHAPRGITAVFGEGGDDSLYGGRGNDRLFGGEGADRLYGGIGDDRLRGGLGGDRLSGGFGADSLDGEAGDDFARGDATIDAIEDTGGGTDTLSYATGATPGFFNKPGVYPDFSEYDGLPPTVEGRGAYVNLQTGKGDNGLAPDGGGVDEEVSGANFETVIGTAFPDFIVGTADGETIYGGGGADVLLGEGGGDLLYGGAEGDSCEAATVFECESSSKEVQPRDPGAIAAGTMASQEGGPAAFYLTGSDGNDEVTATYADGSVSFALGPGSEGAFDASPAAAGGCGPPAAGKVVCPPSGVPDSIVLAGLGGEDTLEASGFPVSTSVILLGGDGADRLDGGTTEDALVDGPGADLVSAEGGDDAVPNNEGADDLDAGPGEDLFVSDAICEGDALDGGADRDNANWANFDSPVAIDLGTRTAGLIGAGGQPECPSGLESTLEAIEDIEGTSLGDRLSGDSGPNQLLGRPGPDTYFAAAGDDSILANSGDADPLIDCGDGFDTAQVDHPEYGDATPTSCESIHERDPNSFRPPDTPPDPTPPPGAPPGGAPSSAAPPPVLSPPDKTPPHTRILHRPAALLFAARLRRRVAVAFTSNEPAVRFRCRLDRQPFRPCRSPRTYLVGPGPHTFRVLAIDIAGNRDLTPATIRFKVRRR